MAFGRLLPCFWAFGGFFSCILCLGAGCFFWFGQFSPNTLAAIDFATVSAWCWAGLFVLFPVLAFLLYICACLSQGLASLRHTTIAMPYIHTSLVSNISMRGCGFLVQTQQPRILVLTDCYGQRPQWHLLYLFWRQEHYMLILFLKPTAKEETVNNPYCYSTAIQLVLSLYNPKQEQTMAYRCCFVVNLLSSAGNSEDIGFKMSQVWETACPMPLPFRTVLNFLLKCHSQPVRSERLGFAMPGRRVQFVTYPECSTMNVLLWNCLLLFLLYNSACLILMKETVSGFVDMSAGEFLLLMDCYGQRAQWHLLYLFWRQEPYMLIYIYIVFETHGKETFNNA